MYKIVYVLKNNEILHKNCQFYAKNPKKCGLNSVFWGYFRLIKFPVFPLSRTPFSRGNFPANGFPASRGKAGNVQP